jgi:hypothetical protein
MIYNNLITPDNPDLYQQDNKNIKYKTYQISCEASDFFLLRPLRGFKVVLDDGAGRCPALKYVRPTALSAGLLKHGFYNPAGAEYYKPGQCHVIQNYHDTAEPRRGAIS